MYFFHCRHSGEFTPELSLQHHQETATFLDGAQTCFPRGISIYLHLEWITTYRKKVIEGAVAHRVREMIRERCTKEGVVIMAGHDSRDKVDLLVSIPSPVTSRRLVQRLKGKTSYTFMQEFPHLG